MSVGEKSIATRVAERGIAFQERMQERLLKEMQRSIGYEEVSEKEMTQLIHGAMGGNTAAIIELEKLYQINGPQIDIRINAVLAQTMGKI